MPAVSDSLIQLPDKPSFCVQEAARLIGLSRFTVYRLLDRGLLAGFYVGVTERGIRITRTSIERYLQRHQYQQLSFDMSRQ